MSPEAGVTLTIVKGPFRGARTQGGQGLKRLGGLQRRHISPRNSPHFVSNVPGTASARYTPTIHLLSAPFPLLRLASLALSSFQQGRKALEQAYCSLPAIEQRTCPAVEAGEYQRACRIDESTQAWDYSCFLARPACSPFSDYALATWPLRVDLFFYTKSKDCEQNRRTMRIVSNIRARGRKLKEWKRVVYSVHAHGRDSWQWEREVFLRVGPCAVINWRGR